MQGEEADDGKQEGEDGDTAAATDHVAAPTAFSCVDPTRRRVQDGDRIRGYRGDSAQRKKDAEVREALPDAPGKQMTRGCKTTINEVWPKA
jgi:hypothetical protein